LNISWYHQHPPPNKEASISSWETSVNSVIHIINAYKAGRAQRHPAGVKRKKKTPHQMGRL